jgi:hypothetical protein
MENFQLIGNRYTLTLLYQCVPGGKTNIFGGHTYVCVHMSYSERFPRYSYFTVQYSTLYTVQTSNTPVLTWVATYIDVDGEIFENVLCEITCTNFVT